MIIQFAAGYARESVKNVESPLNVLRVLFQLQFVVQELFRVISLSLDLSPYLSVL